MINKNKTHRLMIQVTINQYNWLVKKSQSLDLSISQLVRWLLNKKIKDVNDITILNKQPKEAIQQEEVNLEDWEQTIMELDKLQPPANLIADDLPY